MFLIPNASNYLGQLQVELAMLEYRLTRGKSTRACVHTVPVLFICLSLFFLSFFSPSFLPSISRNHTSSLSSSLPLSFSPSLFVFTSSLSHPSLPVSLPPSLPPYLLISHPLTPSPSTTRTPSLHVPQGLKHQGGKGTKGADSEAPEKLKWRLIKEL